METTHTPTPYRFDGHGINDANGQRIAKMSECGTIPQYIQGVVRITRNPEFDRVGYLLAAAPELLEALRACADRLGEMDCGPEWEQARAAIAKAEKE